MKSQKMLDCQDERSLINLAQAQQVAKVLCEHPQIKAVVAFGSVARENEGEDLDVILLCDGWLAYEFVDLVLSMKDGTRYAYYEMKDIRRQAAVMLLSGNGELDGIFQKIAPFVHPYDLDIFIFPLNWRKRLDELQGALPHSDPQFMHNIARDARGLWVQRG